MLSCASLETVDLRANNLGAYAEFVAAPIEQRLQLKEPRPRSNALAAAVLP
jgi:hypothetical protein